MRRTPCTTRQFLAFFCTLLFMAPCVALANPIEPFVDCVQKNEDGTYTAFWGYKKVAKGDVLITPGTNTVYSANFFSPDPAARTGQPGAAALPFKTGVQHYVFSTTFTVSDTWTIKTKNAASHTKSATANAYSPACLKPIMPLCDCQFNNGDGTARAYYGFNNPNSTSISVAVGKTDHSANFFSPDPEDRGQPTTFAPGEFRGVVSTLYPIGTKIPQWTIQHQGKAGVCISIGYKACASIKPRVECIEEKPDGTITARFGYKNDNLFTLEIPVGAMNTFTPDPKDRGQPVKFFAGNNSNAFTVNFNPVTTPQLDWTLAGTTVSATADTELCKPNTPPTCDAGGDCEGLNCQGVTTVVPLDGSASSDPENKLSFLWTTDCSNALLQNADKAKATLIFTAPGMGQPVSCNVTLKVMDGRSETTCGKKVSINPCRLDCLNQINGNAVVDLCGVCNGNNACLDCEGTPHGSKVVDRCGVCGGNNACVDCAGVPNGTAKLDKCNVCNGKDACVDCLGKPFGNAKLDACNICGGDGTSCKLCEVGDSTCEKDCLGIVGGNAKVDSCGVCNGTNTCLDCAGVPFGPKKVDLCGVCDGKNACLDCAGVPNGASKVDLCGACGGNNACLDCRGQPFGKAVLDRCGVCEGDGMSCLGCVDKDNTNLLFSLDGSSAQQRSVVLTVARLAKRQRLNKVDAAKIRAIIAKADTLYHENWVLTWALPRVNVSCTNSVLCSQVDNSDTLDNFRARALALKELTTTALNILLKYDPSQKQARDGAGYLRKADKMYKQAVSLSANVPRFESVCSKPN